MKNRLIFLYIKTKLNSPTFNFDLIDYVANCESNKTFAWYAILLFAVNKIAYQVKVYKSKLIVDNNETVFTCRLQFCLNFFF